MDNVPIDTLPQGIYTFYLLAAPEGMMNTYYMWKTEVIIGPPDGAKLYAQNCASCHGPLTASTKAGATAKRTTGRHRRQRRRHGRTEEEPHAGSGEGHCRCAWHRRLLLRLLRRTVPLSITKACASCHGPLATSAKLGTTAGAIQAAIDAGTGGMGGLNNLSAAQVQAIADVLNNQAPPPPPATTDGATSYAQSCRILSRSARYVSEAPVRRSRSHQAQSTPVPEAWEHRC
ncbi:MAG: cytochrome c [Desulfobacterales bacterium]|nr:cytochrome c [Desulfobacterales bacterium]